MAYEFKIPDQDPFDMEALFVLNELPLEHLKSGAITRPIKEFLQEKGYIRRQKVVNGSQRNFFSKNFKEGSYWRDVLSKFEVPDPS